MRTEYRAQGEQFEALKARWGERAGASKAELARSLSRERGMNQLTQKPPQEGKKRS